MFRYIERFFCMLMHIVGRLRVLSAMLQTIVLCIVQLGFSQQQVFVQLTE